MPVEIPLESVVELAERFQFLSLGEAYAELARTRRDLRIVSGEREFARVAEVQVRKMALENRRLED